MINIPGTSSDGAGEDPYANKEFEFSPNNSRGDL